MVQNWNDNLYYCTYLVYNFLAYVSKNMFLQSIITLTLVWRKKQEKRAHQCVRDKPDWRNWWVYKPIKPVQQTKTGLICNKITDINH